MASHKQFACDLAIRLVQEQYGDAVGRVFKQLTAKGQVSLGDIVRGTGMAASIVKQALLILLQQNCINVYLQPGEESFRGTRPSIYVYEPDLGRVLQIIRHSRFLLHIRDEAGEVAEHIVAQLLQEGRLRMDQVLGGVSARMGKPQEEATDTIRNTFISLVQAHYVERAPLCNMPPPAIKPHPNSVKTRKKPAGGSEAFAAEQGMAVRSLEELAFEKARFKVPADLALEMFSSGDGNRGAAAGLGPAAEGGDEATIAVGGGGVKRRADDEPEQLAVKAPPAKKARMRAGTARPDTVAPGSAQRPGGGTGLNVAGAGGPSGVGGGAGTSSPVSEPSVVLWRVNNEEFNRRFRHQAMVALIGEKFNGDAASVVTAMLATARPYESSVKEERSVPLSEDEVEATVGKLKIAGVLQSLPETPVPAVLRTLASDSFDMFTHVGTGPQGSATYVVNSQRIMDLVMLKQVEAVVKSRFDIAGLRVFRLLALRGQLEQKQIADLAMLPPKDTRELLYRMLAGGFVLLQDIPKTADRAPSRTFYTWRVSMPSICEATAGQLFQATGRVYQRLKFEMGKEKELLGLLESAKEAKTVNFTLTAAQRQAVTRLKRVSEVMETSLQHLDEMIAVFNDY
ncbi:hypothetical protein Vretimale_12430 [Volvox reticuliferus]|uniref:DNA-directed RNA polymerase III subunit RPC3 n=1 Tax=Volvox reticuliferus TaxID=1737510 RepID=A0A8J4GJH1_9CHLO|nr:hypothetical protein Vretifemale_9103 [Volvox reticuliferus]GIM08426.1 hypothetical protein Vretimale_12430 [Volvox reticuliferus]